MNKYRNTKIEIDGITFDSKKEGLRYKELKLLERAGLITELKLQTSFELQPSYKKNGKTIRAITYKSDFDYLTKDGRHIVEDVKSKATEKDKVYRLKRKMLQYKYDDIEFKEIL
jgi:hypothetical protein